MRLYTELLDDEVELDLVAIPGGTFWMGSSGKEGSELWKETPRHQVRLSPFLVGQFPVAQLQWRVVVEIF